MEHLVTGTDVAVALIATLDVRLALEVLDVVGLAAAAELAVAALVEVVTAAEVDFVGVATAVEVDWLAAVEDEAADPEPELELLERLAGPALPLTVLATVLASTGSTR